MTPSQLKPVHRPPDFGEPAPFFTARTCGDRDYSLEVAAGRWMVLMLFGTLSNPASHAAHSLAMARRELFNNADAAFFGVSIDPRDRDVHGLSSASAGVRYFWDFDRKVCTLFGLADDQHMRPAVFLIDRAYRIVMAEPIEATEAVLDRLAEELAAEAAVIEQPFAPILTLPRIFEPEFCRELITYFQAGTPKQSGFAAEVGGRTVDVIDTFLKRRQDVTIEDPALAEEMETRLRRRLLPMVKRALGWQATEIERYLVCRYADQDSGFFFPHRDDVTAGTAHRKFAVSLNLNAEDYEGGDLRFPEFGRRTYRPPTGGATVFCCSLLHEATPVTKGVRYVFVPFLYDEAGAKLRRANLALTGEAPQNRRDRRAGRRGR